MPLSQLQLLLGGLTAAITTGEGACTPWATATDFLELGHERICPCVSKRDVDHALVNPGGEGGDSRGLLATAYGGGADEQAEVLAVEGARHPKLAELIDEGLPLGRVDAVASGNSEELALVSLDRLWHSRILREDDRNINKWSFVEGNVRMHRTRSWSGESRRGWIRLGREHASSQ